MKGIPRSHMANSDKKMFMIYSAVVWGVVLLIEVSRATYFLETITEVDWFSNIVFLPNVR